MIFFFMQLLHSCQTAFYSCGNLTWKIHIIHRLKMISKEFSGRVDSIYSCKAARPQHSRVALGSSWDSFYKNSDDNNIIWSMLIPLPRCLRIKFHFLLIMSLHLSYYTYYVKIRRKALRTKRLKWLTYGQSGIVGIEAASSRHRLTHVHTAQECEMVRGVRWLSFAYLLFKFAPFKMRCMCSTICLSHVKINISKNQASCLLCRTLPDLSHIS